MYENLLSVEEIAERYKFHPGTIRNKIQRGEIPAYKVGSKLRLDPTEVEMALVKRREVTQSITNGSQTN